MDELTLYFKEHPDEEEAFYDELYEREQERFLQFQEDFDYA